MNPFVFIVGCPRSGTTLLRRIVDAHPRIAIIHETRWIARYFAKRTGLTPEGLVTPKLIRRLLRNDRFARLGISREELEKLAGSGEPVSYSTFIAGIFDLYGAARGKRLVGDKTPGYVEKIAVLHALWPQAKFVHLIRDGRDVCLATIGWRRADGTVGLSTTWDNDPVSTAALLWEQRVRHGRKAGDVLGADLYYEMRYEALVTQPAGECSKLCAFLGLQYDEAMLRFHEGRTRRVHGIDTQEPERPITPGLRDWRSQMPVEDLERFEAAAGDLLDELGYPRGIPRLPSGAKEQASRIRDLFTRDVADKRRARRGGS